jgi:hypothetical protein
MQTKRFYICKLSILVEEEESICVPKKTRVCYQKKAKIIMTKKINLIDVEPNRYVDGRQRGKSRGATLKPM